jgi:hypothetical protein
MFTDFLCEKPWENPIRNLTFQIKTKQESGESEVSYWAFQWFIYHIIVLPAGNRTLQAWGASEVAGNVRNWGPKAVSHRSRGM